MKRKMKNAISLIVLVITILVVSILAATVIISLSNTNIINEASKTTFKSDMSSYKEAYEMYVASELAKNAEFDRTTLNVTYQDDEFSNIFGTVSDRYKENLKVVGGNLVYVSTDKTENEVLEAIGMGAKISKNQSYIGYYADADGDGKVDGVIFADLVESKSGVIDHCEYSYEAEDKSKLKEYKVIQESYTGDFGKMPVFQAIGDGIDRFYVMGLNGSGSGWTTWYRNLTDLPPEATSESFGTGKTNTDNMVLAWNNETYGYQSDYDIWGVVQSTSSTLNYSNGWFVPSKGEWAAFFDNLKVSGSNCSNLRIASFLLDFECSAWGPIFSFAFFD